MRVSTSFPGCPAGFYRTVGEARDRIRQGDCAGALPLLQQAVREYADDGNLWALLGNCLEKSAEWETAAIAYEKALDTGVTPWNADIGLNPNDIMVNIAGLYAKAGIKTMALDWLRRGLEARFDQRPGIADSPEFEILEGTEEFAALAGLPPEGARSRDEEWLFDIAFLREQVVLLHADPDHRRSAAKLDTMLDQLSEEVPRLTDQQITARIDLFIAALGAGHDLFWPVVAERGAMLPFALKLYVFSDGIYIIDAYDPELIGARIDRFGRTPADEAYDRVAAAFPGDNGMEARWMAPRHLTQAYTLEALGIVKNAKSVTLSLTDRVGRQLQIEPERRAFTPLSPALKEPYGVTAPLYLSRLDKKYWMQKLDVIDALYVQLNQVIDDESEPVSKFAERLQLEASAPDVYNLILDLRHSSGGNGYLLPPLLRVLVHFAASPKKGSLFVIIGRNTFSASQNLITDLDWIVDPVFVGEPSGSRPNALSESGHFVLPFSRLSGVLSSQYHQHSWPEDHRIWIAPDVPVGLSSIDFFAGHDPAMSAIREILKPKQDFAASMYAGVLKHAID